MRVLPATNDAKQAPQRHERPVLIGAHATGKEKNLSWCVDGVKSLLYGWRALTEWACRQGGTKRPFPCPFFLRHRIILHPPAGFPRARSATQDSTDDQIRLYCGNRIILIRRISARRVGESMSLELRHRLFLFGSKQTNEATGAGLLRVSAHVARSQLTDLLSITTAALASLRRLFLVPAGFGRASKAKGPGNLPWPHTEASPELRALE